MSLHLVTGHAGSAHINSNMVGRFNAGTIGDDAYILDTQDKLACTVVDNNNITIETGDAVVQGRHVTNEAPVSLTIQSGAQNVGRHDLVCIEYTNVGGVESATLVLIKGTAAASPVDPSYNSGSILDNDQTVDIPIYRVVLDGLNIDRVDTLAETVKPISTPLSVSVPVIYAIDVDVVTTANSYVSPFSAYGEIVPNLPDGAVPIAATIKNAASTNPCTLAFRMNSNPQSLSVYSHAAATIKVRIAYRIRDTFPQ